MTGNPLWDLLEAPWDLLEAPPGRSSRRWPRGTSKVIPRYLKATGHRRPSLELVAAAIADYAAALPSALADRLSGVDDPEVAGPVDAQVTSRRRTGPPRRVRTP